MIVPPTLKASEIGLCAFLKCFGLVPSTIDVKYDDVRGPFNRPSGTDESDKVNSKVMEFLSLPEETQNAIMLAEEEGSVFSVNDPPFVPGFTRQGDGIVLSEELAEDKGSLYSYCSSSGDKTENMEPLADENLDYILMILMKIILILILMILVINKL